MSEEERRLAAIVFTDMVAYTALGQRNESLSLALVEEQRRLVRPILNRHSGREVKTMGDAFLVEFPNALDAVRCAYDIQRAVREFNISLPAEKRIHLRVGVHLGDVVESQGDISGDAVNVASRIESLAEDGGVCLTRQVYDQVQNKFELSLESLGSKSLKNVSVPLEVYRMVMPWDEERVIPTTQFDEHRIAVLPFANMSPDPNDEYFADGMTEELITTLSGVKGLIVIARTSVMKYKTGTKGVGEIGRELRAGTLIEGSVRKSGDRIRITVQLVNSNSEGHLWAQNYDRSLDDVFAVQTDVAKQVAEALQVRILSSDMERIEKKPTENTEAYLLYMKGRQLWTTRTKEAVNMAIECFELAIEQDPKFALAYVGLADCYIVLSDHGYMDEVEAAKKVRPAVSMALQLDGELAEAHTARAWQLWEYDWNLVAAETECRKAIKLNTNLARAHQAYSTVLMTEGRLEGALTEATKALELDPMAPIISYNIAYLLSCLGRYDEAIGHHKRSVEIEPNFVPGLGGLASVYALRGERGEATSWWERQARLLPKTSAMMNKALLHARLGEKSEALHILDTVILAPDFSNYRFSGTFASVYALLGDEDKMFEWLERALKLHDSSIMGLKTDPDFNKYRSHPRVLAILKETGLVEK